MQGGGQRGQLGAAAVAQLGAPWGTRGSGKGWRDVGGGRSAQDGEHGVGGVRGVRSVLDMPSLMPVGHWLVRMQQLRDEARSGKGFSVSFTHTPQDKGLAGQLALGPYTSHPMASEAAQDGKRQEEGVLAFRGIDTLALLGWELVCLVTLYTYEGG